MASSTSFRGSSEAHERSRVFALWTGVLAGPAVWLTLLEANYVLSHVACEMRQTWFLHVNTIVAVGLVAAAGLWAWRAAHRPRDWSEPLTAPVSPETCDLRARWMSRVAAVSSAWFILVIIAMEVPAIVLRPCQ